MDTNVENYGRVACSGKMRIWSRKELIKYDFVHKDITLTLMPLEKVIASHFLFKHPQTFVKISIECGL